MVKCSNCHQPIKDSEFGWHNIMCNKEYKMTRDEAIKKCLNGLGMKPVELGDIKASQLVDMLEALRLLKFDEKKQAPYSIIELAQNGDIINRLHAEGIHILNKYGTIRLEEWPEGLVLWVGGEIVWKSWE